jgi:redox-sensitive bicupin YhaK (pirin superfamily)
MEKNRKIQKVIKSQPTLEGAGVHLKRAFAFREVPAFDPFLLLDDFRSTDPRYYINGFPWHPHRGSRPSYILRGVSNTGTAWGNQDTIGSRDVQWMTAGRYHPPRKCRRGKQATWAVSNVGQPRPRTDDGPSLSRRESNQIPEISMGNGVTIRIICGEVKGRRACPRHHHGPGIP